jgi:hypothetical protein
VHWASIIRRRLREAAVVVIPAKAGTWIAIVASLLFIAAQLGTATHALHLTAKAETTCGFCVGGTHWAPGSSTPAIVHTFAPSVEVRVAADDVCQPHPLITPRSSRGPPSSNLFA